MDQPSGLSAATAFWDRMLMECDQQGHVLWMNGRARARLGQVDSLYTAVPAPDLPKVTVFLTSGDTGRKTALTSSLQSPDRPARVPVQFVRLMTLENRVVLAAEMRARASDRTAHQEVWRTLLELQARATRNYFRLEEACAKLEAKRRRRSAGAIAAVALENERTRIARELHSGVGQTLAGIKVNLELIDARMPSPPESVRTSLSRIHALSDQALSEIRFVSQRLHPPDWQSADLRDAIELLWSQSGVPQKFHATLEIHSSLASGLPDAVRFAVYRAVQEGLSNVLRHSGASEVRLELEQRDDRVLLTLHDNGGGFDADAALQGERAAGRGIGLRAMREEILGLGGQFHLTSGKEGTRLEISVPITENR